jgi:flagellar hook-basal body complex protein FliE
VTVTPFVPDTHLAPALESDSAAVNDFNGALSRALDAAGNALGRADEAERQFAAGRGGLQEMVVERAQADVALAIAGAAAARTVAALNTILGMQV